MSFRISIRFLRHSKPGLKTQDVMYTLSRITSYAILIVSFALSNVQSSGAAASSGTVKGRAMSSQKQLTEAKSSKSDPQSRVNKSKSSSSSDKQTPIKNESPPHITTKKQGASPGDIKKTTYTSNESKNLKIQSNGKDKQTTRNSNPSVKTATFRSSSETHNSKPIAPRTSNQYSPLRSSLPKSDRRVSDLHSEITPGVRIATRTTMNSSVRAVGQAAEIGEDAGRVAVGLAGKSALYAGQTAVDMAYIPIDLADHLGRSGRKKGPGYDTAAAVIGKNRFSRALSPLAGRAVNNHPFFARRGAFMLNPCPGAKLGRGVSATHDGLDLIAPAGSPIYAALPGRCVYSGREFSGYGNVILIAHGNDLYTLYSHNSQNLIGYGQCVNAGQRIALVGNTGRTSGPHLHFEMRLDSTPIDPLRHMR